MGAKVKGYADDTIHVSELKDGQVAVITSWNDGEDYKGLIIQRYSDAFISIGNRTGLSWSTRITKEKFPECKVKVLPPGTEIILTEGDD